MNWVGGGNGRKMVTECLKKLISGKLSDELTFNQKTTTKAPFSTDYPTIWKAIKQAVRQRYPSPVMTDKELKQEAMKYFQASRYRAGKVQKKNKKTQEQAEESQLSDSF